jgi:hypothetical protein
MSQRDVEVAELGEVIEECAIRVLAEAARRVGGVVAYRSDGETRGNVFRSPFWVSTGEGFPERRRKSSWSMARGLWPGACGVELSCRKSRLGGRVKVRRLGLSGSCCFRRATKEAEMFVCGITESLYAVNKHRDGNMWSK